MKFNLYKDINEFFNETYELLLGYESENMVLLGNLIIGHEGKDKTAWRDPANWFMATVSGNDEILLIALMTPPANLTLFASDDRICEKALICLAEGIMQNGVNVPGVMAKSSLATSFADIYKVKKDVTYIVSMNQRIYELTDIDLSIPKIGSIRLAKESDLSFIPYWIEGFNSDCFSHNIKLSEDIESYRYYINSKDLFVLEVDDTPVSMTRITRKMKTVCGIGNVYTPIYFRNKGYASACVAAVSRLCFENGFSKCVLYTDLANPTSNSIYQKIGYKYICDSLQIKFN